MYNTPGYSDQSLKSYDMPPAFALHTKTFYMMRHLQSSTWFSLISFPTDPSLSIIELCL